MLLDHFSVLWLELQSKISRFELQSGGEQRIGLAAVAGPNRNGISAETGLLKSWPATGPKILWRIPLGEGFSGVSISQGRAYTTSILQGDYLYGFDGGTLKCIEWNTGAEKWRQRGFGVGTLIYADGHLIVLGDKGKLALVEAAPTGYKEKAAAEILDGRCITVPALAAGKLYVRNTKELACLDMFGQY